jgi:hypothetical protein
MAYSKVTFRVVIYIIQGNHTCVYTEGRKSHDTGCFTQDSRCFRLDLNPVRSSCADTPRNPISSRQTTNSEIVRRAFPLLLSLPRLSLFRSGYEQESKPQFLHSARIASSLLNHLGREAFSSLLQCRFVYGRYAAHLFRPLRGCS